MLIKFSVAHSEKKVVFLPCESRHPILIHSGENINLDSEYFASPQKIQSGNIVTIISASSCTNIYERKKLQKM